MNNIITLQKETSEDIYIYIYIYMRDSADLFGKLHSFCFQMVLYNDHTVQYTCFAYSVQTLAVRKGPLFFFKFLYELIFKPL